MKKVLKSTVIIILIFGIQNFLISCALSKTTEDTDGNFICIYNKQIYKEQSSSGYSFKDIWYPLCKATRKNKATFGESNRVNENYSGNCYLFDDISLQMFVVEKSVFGDTLFCKDENALPQIENNEPKYIIITPNSETGYDSKKNTVIDNKEEIAVVYKELTTANQNINKNSEGYKHYDDSNSFKGIPEDDTERCVYIKYRQINALYLFGYIKNNGDNDILYLYQEMVSQEDNYLNWILSTKCSKIINKE
ncbi:MAG: hypothetical protein IJJ41_04625 [Clostridia bacterium]|nr:hypothetical protein [Clostridia bacterium]